MLIDTTGDALVIFPQAQMDACGAFSHLEVHPFLSTAWQTGMCGRDAGGTIATTVQQRPVDRWVRLKRGVWLDFCMIDNPLEV